MKITKLERHWQIEDDNGLSVFRHTLASPAESPLNEAEIMVNRFCEENLELARVNADFEALFKKCYEATKGMPIMATINGLREEVADLKHRLEKYVAVIGHRLPQNPDVIEIVFRIDRRFRHSSVIPREQVYTDLFDQYFEKLMRLDGQ